MSDDFGGKKRSELPDNVFGIPQERKYPMPDEKHTRSAIKLFNHVEPKYEEQLAKAIIKNMKKYNIDASVVGPNNRLRKYLPKDMIKEYVEEACKDLTHARKLCNAVRKLARKYNANYFFVTDGASSYSNGNGKYNLAAKEMRDHMDDWERNNGFNPDDDWTNDINNVSNYRLLKESSMLEGYFKSDKDIYYNKDKFDSGEINLCFITGLSGSGKSTMGRGMLSKDVEHYEMDDIICNYAFSDDNLKEYGGLVESFFKGPGKEYRLKRGDEDHNNAVFDSHENYEKEITQLFVKHAISYCKSHKGIKYVCDGIWIFMFIKPEQLKDCAVYIKGTSSIKSGYRALKRDIDEDKRNGMTSLQIFKHEFKRVKEDVLYAKENQKELKSFRSYFEKQSTNESYIEESSHNKVYHLSQTNLNGKTIQPTVPSNYMTKNGYEDGKTKRVCFATSIDGCLRGLSQKCKGMKLFVHVPDGNYNIYKPSNKEVPDASITGEVWIKKAVKMKCIGQIYVIGDKGEDGIPYKYGDKTAELYDWEWKWIDKFNESVSILPQDTGISTVIFDIGDVLVSTNIKNYLVADPEVPNEIVDELLKLWFIDKDEVDDTMDLDTYREIVNKRMGTEFSKYIPNLFKANIDCVDIFDYTIPMIQDLKDKGYKVYFLSNLSAWTHDLLQEAGKFDFLKLMDGGVFSYDVGYMKPDEEIYKILLNKYKITPEEALFFDDREENIEAANKLGIHGVHFPRHDSSIIYTNLYGRKLAKAIYEDMDNIRYDFDHSYDEEIIGDMASRLLTLEPGTDPMGSEIGVSLQEYGTTGGTIVGANQPDSVYIVNYMQNNVFSGYKEPKQAICKKGMNQMYTTKNGKAVPIDKDKFKEEASDIHVYRYKGKPKNEFFDIIEEMKDDNDLDLYKLITGREIKDRSEIRFDGDFIEEECFFDTIDAIRACTEAELLEASTDLHPVPILTETVQGRPYNYYRDLNGVFIQHEITGLRSKSYDTLDDIPDAETKIVKRGYLV